VRTEFSSPWSTSLKLITAASIVLLGYVAAIKINQPATPALIAAVLLISAAFAVRGYSVTPGGLVIKRLGWSTQVELSKLGSVEVAPAAMSGSLRVFGIGGLFSFVGLFRNARLGWYRCYATDPARAVVLRFSNRRVVVTPDNPAEFAQAITTAGKGA
jgi:hypothetical protein